MPGTTSSPGLKRFVVPAPSRAGTFPLQEIILSVGNFFWVSIEKGNVKIDKGKRNTKSGGSGRVPRGPRSSDSCQRRDDDALILTDELDVDMASEFPGLKAGDGDTQTREEEVVEYEPETFGKAADPVRIYLKEM